MGDSLSYLDNLLIISSGVADIKTGWLSQSWPCIEPVSHFSQKDDYNCGVIFCLVSTASSSLAWICWCYHARFGRKILC